MPAPGVATTACPDDLAVTWQFVNCHGGLPPGRGSTRHIPNTLSGCQKCPPGRVAGVELLSHTPPLVVVLFCTIMMPSVCPTAPLAVRVISATTNVVRRKAFDFTTLTIDF